MRWRCARLETSNNRFERSRGSWPAPSFIDTLFGAMMHNEVSYGTQAF